MNRPANAHCREEDLTLLLFAELEEEQAQRTRDHLGSCLACRRAYEQLQRTLAQVPRPQLNLDIADRHRFSAGVLARLPRPHRSARFSPLWGSTAAAAALLLALVWFAPFEKQPLGLTAKEDQILHHLGLLEELELLDDLDLLEALEGLG